MKDRPIGQILLDILTVVVIAAVGFLSSVNASRMHGNEPSLGKIGFTVGITMFVLVYVRLGDILYTIKQRNGA